MENDETYMDPEYEFRCPKFEDFEALKQRLDKSTLSTILDRSTSDEWFNTEEARELEYLDDEKYADENYREALLGMTGEELEDMATTTSLRSFLSQMDVSGIVHHVHHESAQENARTKKRKLNEGFHLLDNNGYNHNFTVPQTPRFHTNERARKRQHAQLTTEEMRMQAVLKKKRAAERKRKEALRRKHHTSGHTASGKYYQAFHAGPSKSFAIIYDRDAVQKHKTAKEIQGENADNQDMDGSLDFSCDLAPATSKKNQDQISALQSPHASRTLNQREAPRVTKPIPFRFGHGSTHHKSSSASSSRPHPEKPPHESKYHALSQPHSRQVIANQSASRPRHGPTVTREFRFNGTSMSSNKPKPLTSEERELREIRQVPKFKARPVPRKVLLGAGQFGVPKVAKKRCTVPISPKFNSAGRKRSRDEFEHQTQQKHGSETAQRRNANTKYSVRVVEMGDKLQPTRKISHVVAISKKPPRPISSRPTSSRPFSRTLTIPKTPNFATRSRIRSRSTVPAPQDEKASSKNQLKFRARPMPIVQPFRPKVREKKLTQPRPFNLHTETRGARERDMLKTKLEKAQQQLSKQAEFKARPVVTSQHPSIPFIEKRPLTDPKPFTLHSETLHEQALSKWNAKMDEETRKRTEAFRFKARPMPLAEPFQLRSSEQPLTEFSEFPQFSDTRAVIRQDFDLRNELRLKELEDKKRIQIQEEQNRIQKGIEQMRNQMQFQARPLPSFYQKSHVAEHLNDGATIPKGSTALHNKRMFKKLENISTLPEGKENQLQHRQQRIQEFLQTGPKSLLPQQQSLRLTKTTVSSIIRSGIQKPSSMREQLQAQAQQNYPQSQHQPQQRRQQQQQHLPFNSPGRRARKRSTLGGKFTNKSFKV